MSEDQIAEENSKVRVSFDVRRAQVEIMDKMKEDCGLSSHGELINSAMTLFHWAIKESKKGRRLASVDPSDEKILELIEMPTLKFVRDE
jgi:hypothetical protein